MMDEYTMPEVKRPTATSASTSLANQYGASHNPSLNDALAAALDENERLKHELRAHEELRCRMLLAVGAAHDIGNVLMAVLGMAQLLQQEAPPQLHADLQRIALAANDGTHLLHRVFAMRMPEVAPRPRIESVSALIHDALGMTRHLWDADDRISIRTHTAETGAVSGHRIEIRGVLINLITNAIEAMPAGGTLTVSCTTTPANVIIEVSDTGVGISVARQEEVFRPFVSTQSKGRGLGLSVSRAIVEEYGGTLTLQSAPTRGTTFTVTLPRVDTFEALATPERPPVVLRARALSSGR